MIKWENNQFPNVFALLTSHLQTKEHIFLKEIIRALARIKWPPSQLLQVLICLKPFLDPSNVCLKNFTWWYKGDIVSHTRFEISSIILPTTMFKEVMSLSLGIEFSMPSDLSVSLLILYHSSNKCDV